MQDLTNTTLAVWTRPLDSCDFSDIPVFMGVERSLVWAYGFNKWDADKLVFPSLVRGVKAGVKLYTNPNATAAPDASASSLVLAMPSYPVPPLNSTYACVNVAVPSDRPYSIVGYTGVANTSLVHHMTAYACAPGVTPAGAPGAYECSKGVPAGCETVQMIWGPGAWPFVAPAAAGFLLNGTTTMVLQAHYQNPNGTVGRVSREVGRKGGRRGRGGGGAAAGPGRKVLRAGGGGLVVVVGRSRGSEGRGGQRGGWGWGVQWAPSPACRPDLGASLTSVRHLVTLHLPSHDLPCPPPPLSHPNPHVHAPNHPIPFCRSTRRGSSCRTRPRCAPTGWAC